MKRSFLILLIAFCMEFSPAQAAAVYKCQVNGHTVYTDQPCKGQKLTLSPINASDSDARYYSSTQWFYNMAGYKQAAKASERYDAPVFIFFEADWCTYCRKLEKELLHKAGAKNALKPFVTVQISPEDGQQENTYFRSLGGKGYPSIFIQKTASAKPQQVYLQTQENGQWRTQTIAEFRELLSLFLVQ